ncbi:sarcosine oxidase subunit gamma [Marinibacterium profundimaris]|uniref:Sarcosine oxidase subunit gamma n=1 Tax=Marinibacterium profundimaris TaxID=1679460 RepID=A0A225NMW0_9RHOB|nr:sarcosine oxidase subunit gamma family protein [Marinibacterium profundimaris]OWU74914.1 sarcosine oxidase subunit gamma [Marinibacterium profundimaris]
MNAPVPAFSTDASAGTSVVRVTTAAPCARLSLRARGELGPLEAALGLDLPRRIGARAEVGETEVLCLGPDEWMLRGPEAVAPTIRAACDEVYKTHPMSLVDVSGREVTFVIEGTSAAELLTLGCPRDIDRLAVGEGRRTVFDGATVVLWRDATDRFRMDVWHSFAPHVFDLLATGCRELAAEAA